MQIRVSIRESGPVCLDAGTSMQCSSPWHSTHLDSTTLRLSAGAALNWQRRTASADWQGPPQKSANPFGRMSEHLWGEVSPLRLCCCHDVSAWSRCHISAVGSPLLVLRDVPIGVWILGGCDEVILPVSDDVARACEFSRLARFWLTFGTARTSVHGFRPPKKVFRPSPKLHVPAGAVASSMGTSGWCFSCRLLIQLRMPSASTAEVW